MPRPRSPRGLPYRGASCRSGYEAVDAGKVLAEAGVDRAQVDPALDEATLEDLAVGAPALVVAVRPGRRNRQAVRLGADGVARATERAGSLRGEQVQTAALPFVHAHGRVASAARELGEHEQVAVHVLTGEGIRRRVGVGAAVAALKRTTVLEEPEPDVGGASGRVVAVGAEVEEQLVGVDVCGGECVLDVALRRNAAAGPFPAGDVVVVLRASAEVDRVVDAAESVGDEGRRDGRCVARK